MNNVNDVIKSFGGLTKLSQIIDVPVSTIQSWGKTNRIPVWRVDSLKKAAEKMNINLTDSDKEKEEKDVGDY